MPREAIDITLAERHYNKWRRCRCCVSLQCCPVSLRLTRWGRLRSAVRAFEELLSHHSTEVQSQGVRKRISSWLEQQQILFRAVNHFLPGMEDARKQIPERLEDMLRFYHDVALVANEPEALARLDSMIATTSALPSEFASRLAFGRYLEAGQKTAARHGIVNEHIPHSFTAAFECAMRATKDGYDLALIVGPEGFAYEPIFADLGLPTIAVNIPEADYNGARTLKVLDDLVTVRGKRVLIVEDDVQSGATLKKLLQEISSHSPGKLGLYLGNPAPRQRLENVPTGIESVYVASDRSEETDAVFLRHLREHEKLFKGTVPSSVLKELPR